MLTPIDIQNHSLKTAVRGYSKKETDDFLDEILKGYEELYKENRDLKDKVTSLSEGITEGFGTGRKDFCRDTGCCKEQSGCHDEGSTGKSRSHFEGITGESGSCLEGITVGGRWA